MRTDVPRAGPPDCSPPPTPHYSSFSPTSPITPTATTATTAATTPEEAHELARVYCTVEARVVQLQPEGPAGGAVAVGALAPHQSAQRRGGRAQARGELVTVVVVR